MGDEDQGERPLAGPLFDPRFAQIETRGKGYKRGSKLPRRHSVSYPRGVKVTWLESPPSQRSVAVVVQGVKLREPP